MAVLEQPASQQGDSDLDEAVAENRSLKGAVAILAVTVVVLGVLLAVELTRSPEASAPADIEALIDRYVDAIETQDSDAYRSIVTDDFAVFDRSYFEGSDRLIPMIETVDLEEIDLSGFHRWKIDRLLLSVTGENPWFVSAIEDWDGGGVPYLGASIYTVVEDAGELKIESKSWTGMFFRTDL